MSADPWWLLLLKRLGALGEIEEQPGRLVVTVDGRRLDIVMTEDDWDDLVSISFGNVDSAIAFQVEAVKAALIEGVPFLVYSHYNLVASPTVTIPSRWPEMTRQIEEAKRANPDTEFGWYAHKPDRNESQ